MAITGLLEIFSPELIKERGETGRETETQFEQAGEALPHPPPVCLLVLGRASGKEREQVCYPPFGFSPSGYLESFTVVNSWTPPT